MVWILLYKGYGVTYCFEITLFRSDCELAPPRVTGQEMAGTQHHLASTDVF